MLGFYWIFVVNLVELSQKLMSMLVHLYPENLKSMHVYNKSSKELKLKKTNLLILFYSNLNRTQDVIPPSKSTVCSQKFNKRHKLDHETKCEVCDMQYTTKRGLDEHLQSKDHADVVRCRKYVHVQSKLNISNEF